MAGVIDRQNFPAAAAAKREREKKKVAPPGTCGPAILNGRRRCQLPSRPIIAFPSNLQDLC